MFYKSESELSEGPVWHKARESFFWVDILGKKFFECRWSDKKITAHDLSRRVSLVLETDDINKVILAVQGGLMYFNLSTGESELFQEIESNISNNRTNDGGYDPSGRIWIGTMSMPTRKNAGALYCYNEKKLLEKKIDGVTVPNGIVWSRDTKTMYHVDSDERIVNEYEFDNRTGDIKFKRVAIRVPEEIGSPDGMCIDDDGMLWIAHWGGFGVYQWNPVTGKILDKIEIPVPKVSSCAFGGQDMKTLLITTAREHMSEDDLRKYPDSGSIFIA